MARSDNPFTIALSKHDPARLREAFDECRKAGAGTYDRTTLNRWLDGSTPNNGEFVRQMSEFLGDADLFPAWEEARKRRPRSSATPEAVVQQYTSLSYDDRQEAWPELRKLFLERFAREVTGATYRIELRDHPDPDADLYELRLTWQWDGHLPANAWVVVSNSTQVLGDAYEEDTCLFREILPLDDEALDRGWSGLPAPALTYNELGPANQQMQRHVATEEGNGRWRFDNEAAENARVRIGLSYPYPRGYGKFFIRLGHYQFEGGAEITLTLSTPAAHSPDVFTYLPAGRQREYAADLVGPNELAVTLGAGGTILSDGDGAVLFWSES